MLPALPMTIPKTAEVDGVESFDKVAWLATLYGKMDKLMYKAKLKKKPINVALPTSLGLRALPDNTTAPSIPTNTHSVTYKGLVI